VTAKGTQPGAIFNTERLHGNSQQSILAHRLGKVKNMVFVNGETARLIGDRHRRSGIDISGWVIFFFDIHPERAFALAQAAAAGKFNVGAHGAFSQDAALGAQQAAITLNQTAFIVTNINNLV